jgi:hypothetical protein
VGVDVVHCQDIILQNITNFAQKLTDKLPEIQRNFNQNLEDNVPRIEKSINEQTSASVHNELVRELKKCRLALIVLESNGSDATDYTDNNSYLSFDPRRIEKTLELQVSLKEQGKENFTFRNKQERR